MKYTKWFNVIAIALATIFVSSAGAQVGSTYFSAAANAVDIRSPLTAENLYGGTVGANINVFKHVDIGGAVDLQRLSDNRVNLNNFKGELNATVHTKVYGFTPFVRGGFNWNWNRIDAKRFEALGYRVGAGVEVNPLKNITVGGEFYLTEIQKVIAGGSQQVYRPYVVFWLNDHLGVNAAYTYNRTVNSAGYSLGGVFKF